MLETIVSPAAASAATRAAIWTAIPVTSSMHVADGFEAGSTHTFELAFVLTTGQRSEKSQPVTGKTWGPDLLGANGPDGLPDDWQGIYWGRKAGDWPSRDMDTDGDGATNWQEFLAGTDPNDPRSVLKTRFSTDAQGRHLNWNAQPGYVYQVQTSTNVSTWENLGSPRRAAGSSDSIVVDGTRSLGFYRVIRLQ